MLAALLGLATCLLLLYLLFWVLYESADKNLPPGPSCWPVFGNAWHLLCLTRKSTEWCQKLSCTYGDMTTLKVGRAPLVLINSPEVVYDLLQKNAGLTSGRPMINSFRFDNVPERIIVGPTDENFRRIRKLYNMVLSRKNSATWEKHQEFESLQLLSNLLEKPTNFFLTCERYATNVVSLAIYGQRFVEGDHDSVVHKMFGLWETEYLYFLPWTLPIDFFPSLLKLPKCLQPWQKLVEKVTHSEEKVHKELLGNVSTSSCRSHTHDSFASSLLRGDGNFDGDAESICHILAMLHGAGSDSVSGILQLFFKIMVLKPEAMRTASKEIDDVVGPDRLPSFQDRRRLPYVEAVIKEMHRWAPLANIGVPHALNDNLEYKGYRLPRGTILVPNLLALSHHEDRYPNPMDFDPMRFYGDEIDSAASAVQGDYKRRDHFMYGFGRRFCPGSHVAEATLFIAIARILWAFEITLPEGSKVKLEDQRDGLLRKPKPFKLHIKPRQADIVDKIKRAHVNLAHEREHSQAV